MMKWIVVLLSVPTLAMACNKGEYEYRGDCIVDIQPITAPPVQPSDEKVPDDKMPSYQRPDVTVINAPNTATEDERMDREKIEADKQGKLSAGIKSKKEIK